MTENNNNKEKIYYQKNNNLLTSKTINENTKFYENNNPLKVISKDGIEEDYSEADFKSLIKEKVTQFIGKKFDNIILFGGAGTSIIGPDDNLFGKTMLELWAPIKNKLQERTEDSFTLEELARKVKFEIKKNSEKEITSNLENFMSVVLQYENFVKGEDLEKYKNSKHAIYDAIIEKTSYNYDTEIFNHSAIMKILNETLEPPNRLTVVTTNYDLMFEQAAAELLYTVVDGFSFNLPQKFNSDLFNWHLVKPVSNITTKELEYNEHMINLLKIHGSIDWYEISEEIVKKSKEFKNENEKLPVMIFPNTKKYAQSYKKPYFELFSKLQEFLNKNNTLVITSGFSFGDLHITSMFENAIKNNNGLYLLITDFDINKTESEGWDAMKKLSEEQYPIAFLQTAFQELVTYLEEM